MSKYLFVYTIICLSINVAFSKNISNTKLESIPSSLTLTLETFIPNLTVTSDTTALGNVVICENDSFEVGEQSFFNPGDYEVTLLDQAACDSIITFSLSILSIDVQIQGNIILSCLEEAAPLNSNATILDPDFSYAYNWYLNDQLVGVEPSHDADMPGDYTLEITAFNDTLICIFTDTIEVIYEPTYNVSIIENNDTICSGDCVTLSAISNGNSSSFEWSNGSNEQEITVCPDETSLYTVTATDNTNCSQQAEAIVDVYDLLDFGEVTFSICLEDTVDLSVYAGFSFDILDPSLILIFNNQLIPLNVGDTDINIFDQNSCEQFGNSIFVLIEDCKSNCVNSDTLIVAEICQGESLGGYSETGFYIDTIAITSFCDSIVNLDLTVSPTYLDSNFVSICFGDTFSIFDEPGIYPDTLVSSFGCDSISVLVLEVMDPIESFADITLCEGSIFGVYDSTGVFIDTLTSIDGCDSIVTIDLTIIPLSFSSIEASICEGQSYEGYIETGMYTDTLIGSMGCDSIRSLNLEVIPLEVNAIEITICEEESYLGYTVSGNYQDTLPAMTGCDTLRNLDLTVIQLLLDSTFTSICEGDEYLGYSQSGMYQDSTISAEGCLQIEYIDLTVVDTTSIQLDTVVCPNDTIFGQIITEEGQYTVAAIDVTCLDSIVLNISFFKEGCTTFTSDEKLLRISVYPNPVASELIIESSGEVHLEIYSLEGIKLNPPRTEINYTTTYFDVSKLVNGLYLIHASNKSTSKAFKFYKIE